GDQERGRDHRGRDAAGYREEHEDREIVAEQAFHRMANWWCGPRPGLTSSRSDAARSMAGATGLEPATSGVTGRRSNQLSYAPATRRSRRHLLPRRPRGVKQSPRSWQALREIASVLGSNLMALFKIRIPGASRDPLSNRSVAGRVDPGVRRECGNFSG